MELLLHSKVFLSQATRKAAPENQGSLKTIKAKERDDCVRTGGVSGRWKLEITSPPCAETPCICTNKCQNAILRVPCCVAVEQKNLK